MAKTVKRLRNVEAVNSCDDQACRMSAVSAVSSLKVAAERHRDRAKALFKLAQEIEAAKLTPASDEMLWALVARETNIG